MSKLTIVGIGPGNRDNMTIAADKALQAADVIIGYTVYADLVRDDYPGKEFITTPMTKEIERCRIALELAGQGKNVVLICSGDSGIYGMAGPAYELRGNSSEPEIRVVPGITAAASGGALLGAPLTHDFAVISLSDRLTDQETIIKRLELAAEADDDHHQECEQELHPDLFYSKNIFDRVKHSLMTFLKLLALYLYFLIVSDRLINSKKEMDIIKGKPYRA